ncbi:hypothetical protein [Streptomyces sp. SID1121]|uniref:hypothetical protein n=1 Tax=Streptomyces sp. SID1121 TaxID=3425888 RepID=UPI00405605B9
MNTTPSTAPATRVNLDKHPATYLVLADVTEAFTAQLALFGPAQRHRPLPPTVHVVRQADDPQERETQWDDLADFCTEAQSQVSLRTYTAISHGHAAYLARWDHAVGRAAENMAEVIGDHVARGARGRLAGWIAIRIADGRSDNVLYPDAPSARAAQKHPERCTVVPLNARNPLTVEECERFLTSKAHELHGCLGRDFHPTCR